MTTEDECDYIMSSNNARKNVIYTPKEGSQIIFDPKGNWWGGSLIGTAYTEFNGVKLVAVQNSNTTSKTSILSPLYRKYNFYDYDGNGRRTNNGFTLGQL